MSRPLAFIAILLVLLSPAAASAQVVLETVGSRALGMGGAFTGVADDATAVYWNPAGLASGPPGGMTIGWVDFRTGNQGGVPEPGVARRTSKFVSLGTWPIGLSYGRFDERSLADAIGAVRIDSFRVSQYGATLVQTLTPGLVIGSTLKYVRGTVLSSEASGATAREALRAASDLEGPRSGHFDLDMGLMADLRRLRIGVSVRNILEPKFEGIAGNAIQFRKQARIGIAVLPVAGLTLAMDLDLDTVDLRDGPRRILAFGGEDRLGRRLAVRGGVRWSLEGAKRRVGTAGLSIALRPNLWLDGHYTHGRLDADRGFGAALRAGF
jgi:hypothetical protein